MESNGRRRPIVHATTTDSPHKFFEATKALASALTVADAAMAALRYGIFVLEATSGTVALLDGAGAALEVVAESSTARENAVASTATDLGVDQRIRAARERRVIWFDSTCASKGRSRAVAVPIAAEQRALGVMSFDLDSARALNTRAEARCLSWVAFSPSPSSGCGAVKRP